MKKLIPSLGLSKLTILGFAQFVVSILESMTANVNFTTPTPALADILIKLDRYRLAITDTENKVAGARVLRNQLRLELGIMISDLANYCVRLSDGDEAIFLTSGFKLRKTSQPAPDPLAVAQNLRLVSTTNESELRILFEAVPYARSYEIYMSINNELNFAYLSTISAQRYLLRNLTPGSRYFIKIKAIGPKGITGGFSDVCSKIAA